MTLRDKIKKLCKEAGIPITKLETDLGFARGYISKLDKSTPRYANLQKIANYFGVGINHLVTETENHSYMEDTMLYIRISKDTELEHAIKKILYSRRPRKKAYY